MPRILIVYATVEGQTEKIAHALGTELKRIGHTVDTRNVREFDEAALPLSRFQGVVVGAPVHYSRYPASIRHWVSGRSAELSRKPSAFFSVSLGILQTADARVQDKVRRIAQRFFRRCGWQPRIYEDFAGALAYSRYGWLKRRAMREIARRAGGDTDMQRDREYTDWEQVRRFAREFSDLVGQPGRHHPRVA